VAKKLSTDLVLLAVTVALLGFGLVMVWSASSALAQERHGSPYYFLLKQIAWSALGLAGMVAALRLDYRTLRRPGVVYSLLLAATLLLVVVLFLRPVNETHRWIRLGALSFQPDLGIAFCLVLTAAVMLYVAGVRLKYFAALAIPALVALYAAVMSVPWRRVRVTSFIDPWSDPQGAGYQVIQSLIALGTGGVTGVGVMQGKQKLFYLPYPYSDFIFAVIGEELGMLGALAVVAAFVVLLWRGLKAAWSAPDDFGRFLAAGVTLSIVFQALVNISVVLGLLPTKGIPLPFISAGGSSLVFALFGVGLVANVAQHGD
jgi:cell division protein FtsW